MPELIHPAFILYIGAALAALLPGRARAVVVLLAPLLTLWAVWQVPDGVAVGGQFLGYDIQLIEGDALRRLFATVFSIMTFAGALFAFRDARRYELAAALAYAAGAVGISFAGDLLTLFVFWELMAVASTVVVWCGGTPAARAAGIRYALMHLLGGVLLQAGIIGLALDTGSLDVRALAVTDLPTALIFIGVLVNAAAPPVSAWLADAYPEASPSGAVFLSAYTTKSAVLALILLFPGEQMLVFVGLYMVFYGILYALLENDARRILAYSIVNQVGFMVCAVGIGTPTALNGAAAHAFAHIIYKGLLLMSAGVVLHRTGKRKCTELGGLFRTMPLTMVCGVVGALAISGFPLTSGFTTKTLISEAAKDEHLALVYFLLAAASAGVFLHAGIKFPWFVFFQKDSGLRPKDAPWNMAAAMVLFAALCILIGIFPEPFYALLPYPVDYHAYAPYKVLFYLQLLLFSGLAFFLLLPAMRRTQTLSLDFDWFWRVAAGRLVLRLTRGLGVVSGRARQLGGTLLRPARRWIERWLGAQGILAKPSPIGSTALWIAVLLTAYVLIYVA